MQPALKMTLILATAGLTCGCAELNEERKAAPEAVAAVQVSKADPQLPCRALGAIDAPSTDDAANVYESAYDALRSGAALRGANFVVIDSVSDHFYAGRPTGALAIHGRLFACAPAGQVMDRPVERCALLQPVATSDACR